MRKTNLIARLVPSFRPKFTNLGYFQNVCRTGFPNLSTRYLTTNSKNDATIQKNTTKEEEDGNLMLSFKCNKCSARTTKFISKRAYNHGTVIIICDGCKSKHLISDNYGWFRDTLAANKNGVDNFNLEKVLNEQGQRFVKGVANIFSSGSSSGSTNGNKK